MKIVNYLFTKIVLALLLNVASNAWAVECQKPPLLDKSSTVYCLQDDTALIKKANGKGGFIDKKGKEIIPFKYDDVDPFSNGCAIVQRNGKKFKIDKKGKRCQ